MIDKDGYRLNVGIILLNQNKKVFWGKRKDENSWQFPQGGLYENEEIVKYSLEKQKYLFNFCLVLTYNIA